jgi:hypothetical protein
VRIQSRRGRRRWWRWGHHCVPRLHARSAVVGGLAPLQLRGINKCSTRLCGCVPLFSTERLHVPEYESAPCLGHAQVQSVLGPQLRDPPQVAARQFSATPGRLQAPIPSREPRILLWSPQDHGQTVALWPSVSPLPWPRVWAWCAEHLPLTSKNQNNHVHLAN